MMKFFTRWDREDSRLIVYGDIHGCLNEFIKLREKTEPTSSDIEVCVGDVISKGPNSKEMVKYLKKEGIASVRGNNEDKIIREIEHRDGKLKGSSVILTQKQLELLDSLDSESRRYLQEMPYFLKFLNITIVHGGVYKNLKLEDASEDELRAVMYIRHLDKDGQMCGFGSERITKESHFFGDIYDGFEGFVVYGHQVFSKPKIKEFSIGVDTGCVYGKSLSAVIFEKREKIFDTSNYKIVSIKAKKRYVQN